MPTNKSGNAGIYDAYDDRPDFEPWKPTKAAPKDVASLLPLIQFCYQTAAQGKTEHDKQPPGACYLEPRHYINSGVKSTGSDFEKEQRHYIGCLSKSLAAGEAELRRAFEADPAAWLADKLTNDNPFVQPGYADPEPSFAGRRWESAPFEGFRVCSQDKGWMNPGIGCTNPAKNKEARSVWGPDSAHGFRCHARVLLRDDCAEHCRAGKAVCVVEIGAARREGLEGERGNSREGKEGDAQRHRQRLVRRLLEGHAKLLPPVRAAH